MQNIMTVIGARTDSERNITEYKNLLYKYAETNRKTTEATMQIAARFDSSLGETSCIRQLHFSHLYRFLNPEFF